ncbi:MAG: bifunctional adenosylcobinamide kinase/adenosylcobinamide-phosphate guanylyltransferase [Ilumatobacteraceae bacterium]
MALTMLFGGARSGKSALAVELGRRHDGAVTFIATAPVVDHDMSTRIARHRAERPAEWETVEAPVELANAIAGATHSMIVIDCLTMWISNLMLDVGESPDDEAIERTAAEVADRAAAVSAPVVAISNEVGLGVHPETALGRRYRDVLGRVNQTWAAAAERNLLLVAGRAIPLVDPWDHLS